MNDTHYLAEPVWGVMLLMSRRDRTAADGATPAVGSSDLKGRNPPISAVRRSRREWQLRVEMS